MDLAEVLHPLLPEHLGVLAIGFLVADAPGRPQAVRRLLHENFGVSVTLEDVGLVITRILASRPELLGRYRGGESVLQPRSTTYAALLFQQYVPVHWQGRCIVDEAGQVLSLRESP
jgi:hypothetical protein